MAFPFSLHASVQSVTEVHHKNPVRLSDRPCHREAKRSVSNSHQHHSLPSFPPEPLKELLCHFSPAQLGFLRGGSWWEREASLLRDTSLPLLAPHPVRRGGTCTKVQLSFSLPNLHPTLCSFTATWCSPQTELSSFKNLKMLKTWEQAEQELERSEQIISQKEVKLSQKHGSSHLHLIQRSVYYPTVWQCIQRQRGMWNLQEVSVHHAHILLQWYFNSSRTLSWINIPQFKKIFDLYIKIYNIALFTRPAILHIDL